MTEAELTDFSRDLPAEPAKARSSCRTGGLEQRRRRISPDSVTPVTNGNSLHCDVAAITMMPEIIEPVGGVGNETRSRHDRDVFLLYLGH